MGKSVTAFKVIVTPRFHFECIFIGVRHKVDKQEKKKGRCHFQDGTRQDTPCLFISASPLRETEKNQALRQFDPLWRETL